MLLDNLFTMLGSVGTAAALFAIVALACFPAVGTLLCPPDVLRRRLSRG